MFFTQNTTMLNQIAWTKVVDLPTIAKCACGNMAASIAVGLYSLKDELDIKSEQRIFVYLVCQFKTHIP